MAPENPDPAPLWDMLDAAESVRQFTAGRTFAEYECDPMLQAAVERKIEIIGEAAAKVSRAFRESHPGMPWQKIIAQRHVLIHDYGEIDQEMIWKVATIHIEELIAQLKPLVPSPPPELEG